MYNYLAEIKNTLNTWYQKKTYFENELSIESDAEQKFKLTKKIEECNQEINRLLNEIKSYSDLISNNQPQKITKENEHRIQYDWGNAPDVSVFFGRTQDINILEKWILEEKCRIIAILGISGIGKTKLSIKLGQGGIGKTDLSLKLAKGIQTKFDFIIWRSLLNAPLPSYLIEDFIKFFINKEIMNIPNSYSEQLSLLVQYLKKYRCLIILDNAEEILEGGKYAGVYKQGYEEYGTILKRIGESDHQSCLILTSREKPHEISIMEGEKKPVRSYELTGLDIFNAKKIFLEIGDFRGSEEEWNKLITFYNGNPLALELSAKHIIEVFNGDILKFLKEGIPIFKDIRDLIDWHFNRLTKSEQEVMYYLAINRDVCSISDLKSDIIDIIHQKNITSTIQSLGRKIPIEKTDMGFTLQPVLIKYMTDLFIEKICNEIINLEINLFENFFLVKATAKEYIKNIQENIFIRPIVEQLSHQMGGIKPLIEKLSEIKLSFQEKQLYKSGYAIGNILNMLCFMKYDLTGSDYSNLYINQAFLRDINLHNVNISNSKIHNCIFLQSFGGINKVIFNHSGDLLAAGDSNSDIRIWKSTTYQQLYTFTNHTNRISSLKFSPAKNFLASGSEDKTICLWDISTGKIDTCLKGHTGRILSIDISMDGELLASASEDQTIGIWDIKHNRLIKFLFGHKDWVRSVKFLQDSNVVVSGSEDKSIRLWNVKNGKCTKVFTGHEGSIRCIAIHKQNNIIASGGEDNTIILWDIQSGKMIHHFKGHSNRIQSLSFNSDYSLLASGSDDKLIKIWSLRTKKCVNTLIGHINGIFSVCFNPTDNKLASGSEDRSIKIWDFKNGICENTLRGYTNWLMAVNLSQNGKMLAVGSEDNLIRIWDFKKRICVKTLSGHKNWIRSVSFSPDNQYLASGSGDYTIRIWNTKTWECIKVLNEHTNWVMATEFNYDGSVLASGSEDNNVKIWDTSSWKCIKTLEGHTNWIRSISFGNENRILASGSEDKSIIIWDIYEGKILHKLFGHTNRIQSVSISPNNLIVASAGDDKIIRIWDINSGKCLNELSGHTGRIRTLVFSPDSKLLASGGEDQIIKLWDIVDKRCIKTLKGHLGCVWSLSFSQYSKFLISVGSDENIIIWAMDSNKYDILRSPRPYEKLNIANVEGLTDAQIDGLKYLGAVEN